MIKEANSIQKTISFTLAGLLLVVFTSSIVLPSQPGQTVSAMNLLQAEDTATPTATLENTPTPTVTSTPTVTPTFISGVLTCNTVVAGVTCTNYGTYLDYNINIIVTGLTGGATAYNITIGTYKRSTSGGNMGMMSDFIHSETSIYSQNKVFSMVRIKPFDAARVDYASFTSGAGTYVQVTNSVNDWRYIAGTRNYPNTLSVRGNVDWPITGYSVVGHIYLYSNQNFVTVTPTSTATSTATFTPTSTPTLTPTGTATSMPTVTPTPYYLGSGYFPTNNLDRCHQQGIVGIGHAVEAQNASARWSADTDINMYYDCTAPHITTKHDDFGDTGWAGYAYICSANGACDNSTAYNDTYVSCEARLNEYSFANNPAFYTNAEVEVIAMHELGHCYSLSHSSDTTSIMGAGSRGDVPNAQDIDLINARY